MQKRFNIIMVRKPVASNGKKQGVLARVPHYWRPSASLRCRMTEARSHRQAAKYSHELCYIAQLLWLMSALQDNLLHQFRPLHKLCTAG